MPVFASEGTHAGEFMVSEANGDRSREAVTVVSGQDLVAGAVVGIVTASGKYAEYDEAAVDGTEDAAGILFEAVDASAADAAGVAIVRDGTFNLAEVIWKSGASQGDIDAGVVDMTALGLIAR